MTYFDRRSQTESSLWLELIRYGAAPDRGRYTDDPLMSAPPITELFRYRYADRDFWSGALSDEAAAGDTGLQSRLRYLEAVRSLYSQYKPLTSFRMKFAWFPETAELTGIPERSRVVMITHPILGVRLQMLISMDTYAGATWSASFDAYDAVIVDNRRSREESAEIEARLAAGSGPDPEGLVYTPSDVDGWDGVISLSADRLEALPARARSYATRIVPARTGGAVARLWRISEEGSHEVTAVASRSSAGAWHTIAADIGGADGLAAAASESYRMWLRMSYSTRAQDPREIVEQQRLAEARAKSKANFSAFRNRSSVEERLIPTLPFLPHGLASSRRWGIEIESGGARGIKAPKKWDRKGDASLRSAWEGYVEVQDFEPYDREVTENVSWYDCPNTQRHLPHVEVYNAERNEYGFAAREDYIPWTECQQCGPITRIERVEPQTIRHNRQADDCAEFVSPILVSMHSNGLEKLLGEISKQPQNSTAGVHVHVEANDLTAAQVATLVFGYDLIEPLIESSYQRDVRTYCKRRDAEQVLSLVKKAKAGNLTHSEVRRGDRYVTVNTNALSAHGTVEFRAMGPVYDYNYLIRWAMFCREMVNVVANGATQRDFSKVKSWSDLLVLFSRFGKEYIRAAVYELTGEKGHQAALAKDGKPVTTEAADADLIEAWAQSVLGTSIRRGLTVESVQARAVGSDGLIITI